MKTLLSMMKIFFMLVTILLSVGWGTAQTSFDYQQYQRFLEENQNLSAAALGDRYRAPLFERRAGLKWADALYQDAIGSAYQLTAGEIELLNEHGFMVSERLRGDNFLIQFLDVWVKDLPVFISTDAILHAFHFYYKDLLQKIEYGALKTNLHEMLKFMRSNLFSLHSQYGTTPEMEVMLRDVDVYLTVASQLLNEEESPSPFFKENQTLINQILQLIDEEQPATLNLFSATCRTIDFSQFKLRGYYLDNPQLHGYFKAMIWLGRTELYLLEPDGLSGNCPKPTKSDIQRQVINAALIDELLQIEEATTNYQQMESTLNFLVGEQDNVTAPQLHDVLESAGVDSPMALLDTNVLHRFQQELAAQPFAYQSIISQILARDPLSDVPVQGTSAFLLFGQRFTIDAYVTGNVVYDKIEFNGEPVCRLFPSTLDVLFTLGNNAALQLLDSELESYHYASNLASLRYLVDQYDGAFWENTMYHSWLNSIRSLNPPNQIGGLPKFMQTGAWWQQKMNTQLSSWTELRYDHLLYAKPSYTSSIGCSFPQGFVEPIPAFYEAMGNMANHAKTQFANLTFSDAQIKEDIVGYFDLLATINTQLKGIAEKELAGETLNGEEAEFVKTVVFTERGYGDGSVDGWYPKLMYGHNYNPGALTIYDVANGSNKEYVVVDYHTTPTDCFGTPKGFVLHSGTGPVDMAVLMSDSPNGEVVAYTGPVMSHYEYVTTNFLRLDDDQWEMDYLQRAQKPNWTNIYTADTSGIAKQPGGVLVTDVETMPTGTSTQGQITSESFPNPFKDKTVIRFTIPYRLGGQLTTLKVFDGQGRLVSTLINEKLPAGSYLTEWTLDEKGIGLNAAGVYYYEVKCGSDRYTGKMVKAGE